MDFLKRLIWIFVSPNRVFDDIRERRVSWVQPWILASFVYALIMWLAMPIQIAVLDVQPNLTTEQIDQQVDLMQRFGFMWIVMAPAGILLITLAMAGLSYVAVTIASRAATFKQYFTLCLYTGIVGMMGQLVSTIITRARGLERIAVPEDGQASLSLRLLAPDSPVARGVFSSIEFFALWSLVLLVMGLCRIFGMSRGHAIAIAVVLWILSASLLVLSEVFAGLSG